MTGNRGFLAAWACLLLAGCGSGCGGATAAAGGGEHGDDRGASTLGPLPSPGVAGERPGETPAAPTRAGGTQAAGDPPEGLAVATFAGGCFWCIEAAFEHLEGVRDAVSGYTGGREIGPTYEEVANHRTSHAEAVRVYYDPSRVTYDQLLHLFWRRIDPIHPDQSFVDRGHQYRSAIFVHSPEQRAAAERSLREIAQSGVFDAPLHVTIEDAGVFWIAEDYHQNFWRTTPDRYHGYHENSGRREFLRAHWGPTAEY